MIATSPSNKSNEMDSTISSPPMSMNIERKKSLKNHRLFKGFSSPDTTPSSPLSTSGSFSRFRKRTSRTNGMFSSQDYGDDMVEDQLKQHLPVLHPPVKKTQSAILLPTTTQEIHPDPCISLQFRENCLITTDRRGRVCMWGRP